jgi:hypothetical protein
MNCDDKKERSAQLKALHGFAAEIAFGSDDASQPVGDRVDYFLANYVDEVPAWLDDHDRELLGRLVASIEDTLGEG